MSDKNQLRDLVFREIVKTADQNPGFKAVVEPLGFFTFMALLDGIVDAVVAAQNALVTCQDVQSIPTRQPGSSHEPHSQ